MSKKLLLSIDPLLHKKMENESKRQKISVTEFINTQLEEYFFDNQLSKEMEETHYEIERTRNLSEEYVHSILLFFDLLDHVTTPPSYLLFDDENKE